MSVLHFIHLLEPDFTNHCITIMYVYVWPVTYGAYNSLGQFVKQRRRWLNGTFAAQIWVLNSGWLWRSNHKLYVKLFAIAFLVIDIIQGSIVRLMGPATMAVLTYNTINTLPVLATGTVDTDRNQLSTPAGITAMVACVLFHAIFLLAHTPRAVPVKDKSGQCTGAWRSDRSSAYRPALFAICIALTTIQTVLIIGTFVVFISRLGWENTPLGIKIIWMISAAPYIMAVLDGLTMRDKKHCLDSFWILLCTSPVFVIFSVFFYLWLPSYAAARISDLSWGNRDR